MNTGRNERDKTMITRRNRNERDNMALVVVTGAGAGAVAAVEAVIVDPVVLVKNCLAHKAVEAIEREKTTAVVEEVAVVVVVVVVVEAEAKVEAEAAVAETVNNVVLLETCLVQAQATEVMDEDETEVVVDNMVLMEAILTHK